MQTIEQQTMVRNWFLSTSVRAAIRYAWLLAITSWFLSGETLSADPPHDEAVKRAFFETSVRPLLVEHCYECHSVNADSIQAGLTVDSRDGLLTGGDSGPAIVPGKPEKSLLIEALCYESYEMPPREKLPDDQIDLVRRWIRDGSYWPDEPPPSAEAEREVFDLEARKAAHWAWTPIRRPAIPTVRNTDWPRQPLDHFVLARLEQAGLRPASDCDRPALLRRLCFDLTGLPPTTDQQETFLSDKRPDAVERLVDRLLASPHFGERWGRHWLDLVRYAESRGHEFDNDAQNAFQYRDYVIRALNSDVPYDQFVREHIAGDLLDAPRTGADPSVNESILGTGFWFLGEWVHSPVDTRKDEADRFDNMIDVMSKTFLGVTVACARCHDHKFDAISTADYYALSGFLQSSDYRQVRFESMQHNREIAERLDRLDQKFQTAIAQQLSDAGREVIQIDRQPEKSLASIVVDYGELGPDEYLTRGYLFGDRPRRCGQPFLAVKRGRPVVRLQPVDAAVSDDFWHNLSVIQQKAVRDQNRLSDIPRPGRTLRTPTFLLTSGDLSCRVRGRGHVVACVDSHRLVHGPLHGETIQAINTKSGKKQHADYDTGFRWVDMKLDRYEGHRIHLEFTPAVDSELQVSLVTQGATSEQRQQIQRREADVASHISQWEKEANEWIDPGLADQWLQERQVLQAEIRRESALAMAMADGTPEDDYVLIRGNASKPGDRIPRRFLSAIEGNDPMSINRGSGRLQLARSINSTENPLTHRVIANRLWHYLMGRGIVATTDDFGVLGQRPTHPGLLDHLAIRFRDQGQSLKQLIRTIVLSRSYRMSTHSDPRAMLDDPNNSLWHHRPPKRLEGETIRDALLTVSGQLDRQLGGDSIPIHLTSFMTGRGRPSVNGPIDGARRRSIYTAVRRNFLSPFMLAFDTPTPFSTMGRRTRSNVPAQALILMNDPFVVQQATLWSERLTRQYPSTDARILAMYREAFARLPTKQESEAIDAFVRENSSDQKVWQTIAHALINTKEFIFLR